MTIEEVLDEIEKGCEVTVDPQTMLAIIELARKGLAADAGETRAGWKLVPIEPTKAMVDAFFEPIFGTASASYMGDGGFAPCWRSAVDAAPGEPA